jgi:DNA-binding NarL/FixJ family response regulator
VLFSAGQVISNTVSSHLDPADLKEYERNLVSAQRQMSPDDWNQAWAKGQVMTLDEAVAFALEGSPPTYTDLRQTSPTLTTRPLRPLQTAPLREREYPGGLSEREVEVLRLVAQGLTDNQVAERLVISPRTVQRHLSSIYGKLDVTTRTAAARLAVEYKLV